ncbi:REJ domain-containing protein [Methylomagnum ishizawai]|uniref:REJ domain-containing protein n=1 Tax=Methylomagnum ishizawai TaxID=1760988 RepID=A0A1Y6CY22_9GAMM|nr:PKD domain-containing protein [Methylomagnum ishizawai]SMF95140.1 REJ domain-containing protein [Methylomagnum ishizawai]
MNLQAWALAGCVAFGQGATANTLNDGLGLGVFGNPNPDTPSPGTVLLAIFDAGPGDSPNAGKTLLVNTRWSYADLVNGVAVIPLDLAAHPDFQAIQGDALQYNVVGAYGLYLDPDSGKANLDRDGATFPFDDGVPNNAPWGVVASGHDEAAFSHDVNDLNNSLLSGVQTYWNNVNADLAGVGATENSGPDTVLVDSGDAADWGASWSGNFGGTGLGLTPDASTVNGVGDIAKLYWITNPSLDPGHPNAVAVLGTLQLSAAGVLSYSAAGANHAPTADAGPAQTVDEGADVTLDGSASSDPDSGQTAQLGYQWTAPDGIALSDPTAPKPRFTAPVAEADRVYTFTLVVTDPAGTASAPATVAITVQHLSNHAPTAQIAQPAVAKEGDSVTLDGSGSSDPDPGQTATLTYQWTAPAGITLSDPTAQQPSFTAPTADADRTYNFTLVVTDSQGAASAPATVAVLVRHINRAPTANAGSAQSVNEGDSVTLDGSASSDPDTGQTATLTYQWTAPAGLSLGDPTAQKPSFTAPTGNADASYRFTLVVTDRQGAASAPASVDIAVKHRNRAPTANAGGTQTVDEGERVTLDGSASSDPDSGQAATLAYRWTAPDGISLSDPTAQKPSFTAPTALGDQTYRFSLVVTDADSAPSAAATVDIQVKHRNQAPSAHPGPDQTVNPGAVVALNGEASADPEGDNLSYHWSQLSGPVAVNLGGADAATASFGATQPGDYVFQLAVADPQGLAALATVKVTVDTPVNHAPTAAATAPTTVEVGAVVALDGSASADPDTGDHLAYRWTQVSGPATTLSSADTDRPIFIAGGAGTYAFKLAVTDSAGLASEASVQVTATLPGPGIAFTQVPTVWRVGQAQTVTFQGLGLKGQTKAKLRFSKNGGRFQVLGSATVAKGRYRWKPAKQHIAAQGILQVCAPPGAKQPVCDSVDIEVAAAHP